MPQLAGNKRAKRKIPLSLRVALRFLKLPPEKLRRLPKTNSLVGARFLEYWLNHKADVVRLGDAEAFRAHQHASDCLTADFNAHDIDTQMSDEELAELHDNLIHADRAVGELYARQAARALHHLPMVEVGGCL